LTGFRELPEHALSGLADDALIDYLRAARKAERHDAMKAAVAVLVFGYHDTLMNRARLKLPEPDVADVVSETLASAIASAFDGSSVGEFKSWLHTILSRRIADYWQKRERTLQTRPLPQPGDEEFAGHEPAVEFEGDALHAQECVRHALEELPEAHLEVVQLYLFGPHSAVETAELVGNGMTEANVHQISSRFQKRVRDLLDEGDTSE
jgi:RNA polymerase sigma factor (sigma-70 family)